MKNKLIESVLHDWVHELPFQMQALLMTAMRGPDTLPKDNAAKNIVRYLRGVVLKPAGVWDNTNNNSFMWGEYKYFTRFCENLLDDHDQYPHHFLMHLIHCAEVVGYCHPDLIMRIYWGGFYVEFCKAMHMHYEQKQEMFDRLNDFGCAVELQKVHGGVATEAESGDELLDNK